MAPTSQRETGGTLDSQTHRLLVTICRLSDELPIFFVAWPNSGATAAADPSGSFRIYMFEKSAGVDLDFLIPYTLSWLILASDCDGDFCLFRQRSVVSRRS